MAEGADRKEWDQLKGEPASAYRAFLIFLDLAISNQSVANSDPDQLFLAAYKRTQAAVNATALSKMFQRWVEEYRWEERYRARAEALMAEKIKSLATIESKTFRQELEAFKGSVTETAQVGMDLSRLLLIKGVEWLQKPGRTYSTAREVREAVDIAVKIGEASRIAWGDALSVPSLQELIATQEQKQDDQAV
jgi:hypothetical protein